MSRNSIKINNLSYNAVVLKNKLPNPFKLLFGNKKGPTKAIKGPAWAMPKIKCNIIIS